MLLYAYIWEESDLFVDSLYYMPWLKDISQQMKQYMFEKRIEKVSAFCTDENWNIDPHARQRLPYYIQFAPVIAKYAGNFSKMRYLNTFLPNWWLTEYSKSDIHNDIDPSFFPNSSSNFTIWDLWSYDELLDLCTESNISFPCMMKSDVWERGVWITYIPNIASLKKRYTTTINVPWWDATEYCIQEYCTLAEEYCLQFYKDNVWKYNVLSLAKRHIPYVIWDGQTSVQDLLDDRKTFPPISELQAVKIKKELMCEDPECLHSVPKRWERIHVVRKASIDYGTVYEKISGNLSTSLERIWSVFHEDEIYSRLNKQVDAILAHIDALDVWRFDVKCASYEDLLAWNFVVIECNAGGAIPCHVYEPTMSIFEKYTEIDAHFGRMKRLAFSRIWDSSVDKLFQWRIDEVVAELFERVDFYQSCHTSMKKKGNTFSKLFLDSQYRRQILQVYFPFFE